MMILGRNARLAAHLPAYGGLANMNNPLKQTIRIIIILASEIYVLSVIFTFL
jgi:hypothetical protein